MIQTRMRTAFLLTIVSTLLIFAASHSPIHAPLLISPYVRPEDINISLGKLRQIALQDFSSSFPLFTPVRQEEYIITIGQWFSSSGGGMSISDRRIPVYILRVYGDRGYVGTSGLRVGVIERVVLIKERRVLAEAVGAAQMLAPIDIMHADMGTELPPAMKTRLAQQPVPSPEATAELQP